MKIESCKLIEFPKIADPRGNLTFIENDLDALHVTGDRLGTGRAKSNQSD